MPPGDRIARSAADAVRRGTGDFPDDAREALEHDHQRLVTGVEQVVGWDTRRALRVD